MPGVRIGASDVDIQPRHGALGAPDRPPSRFDVLAQWPLNGGPPALC
jgi:hypothetical protein